MESVKLAVLGAGSVRCMPPIIGSLATYFGERPIELRFWDADAERLDLFDELARLCFNLGESHHSLRSSQSLAEMAEGATHAIVCVGRNCARRHWGREEGALEGTLRQIADRLPDTADVLSLVRTGVESPWPAHTSTDWPGELTVERRRAVPFDVLRMLNGEDYPYDLFREQATSPIRQWLDASLSK